MNQDFFNFMIISIIVAMIFQWNIVKSMAATSGWAASTGLSTVGNDQASNNSSGFSALPGGFRTDLGVFSQVSSGSFWWCSTESSAYHAWNRCINNSYSSVIRGEGGEMAGFSVRCIKD